jgi:hypothetical protein
MLSNPFVGVVFHWLGGLASGRSKEREMTDEQKKATIQEFNFTKGILVATFSGIMSSCFAYGLDAAGPIADLSASIIIFSSLWGIALKEWSGSSPSTKRTLMLGLATLVLSTIVVGYGNYPGIGGGRRSYRLQSV